MIYRYQIDSSWFGILLTNIYDVVSLLDTCFVLFG